MKRTRRTVWFLVGFMMLTAWVTSGAEEAQGEHTLRFANIFNDNMVLQREKPLTVWGQAKPGTKVTVILTEDKSELVKRAGAKALERPVPEPKKGKKPEGPDPKTLHNVRLTYEEVNAPAFTTIEKTATADAEGNWEVELGALTASFTPKFLAAVSGDASVALKNLLIGEVWVTAGQSNMAYSGNRSGWLDNVGLLESAVRYSVLQAGAKDELKDLGKQADWQVCDGGEDGVVSGVSTIAYLFSKHIHRQLKVPVGVINTATGGSLGGEWAGRPEMETQSHVRVKEYLSDDRSKPAANFNGRIAPIGKLRVRGALYMQGEQQALNHSIPRYRYIFPQVIASFRRAFNEPELPFCIISVQGQGGTTAEMGMANGYAIVTDIHYRTHLNTPGTGFVTGHDISGGLHPNWKRPLAERAVLWALTSVYKDAEGKGVAKRSGSHVTLETRFEDGYAKVYLMEPRTVKTKEGPVRQNVPKRVYYTETYDSIDYTGFALAGEDGRWYPGRVERAIDESFLDEKQKKKGEGYNYLKVSHPLVPKPVALRYGMGDASAHLGDYYTPVPPTRSDDWPTYEMEEVAANRAIMHQMQAVAETDVLDRKIRESVYDVNEASLKLYPGAKELLQSFAERTKQSLDMIEPGADLKAKTEALSAEYLTRLSPKYQDPTAVFGKKALWWTSAHRLKALPEDVEQAYKDKKVAAAIQSLQKALSDLEAAVNELPDTKPLPQEIQPNTSDEYRPTYSSETRKGFYKKSE